jgi:hypothetical protein
VALFSWRIRIAAETHGGSASASHLIERFSPVALDRRRWCSHRVPRKRSGSWAAFTRCVTPPSGQRLLLKLGLLVVLLDGCITGGGAADARHAEREPPAGAAVALSWPIAVVILTVCEPRVTPRGE